MKISATTLSILKNFTLINKGILLTKGNKLQTRTASVYAEAMVEETFPAEVGIYELGNLLSVIALFNDAEYDFAEDALRICEATGQAEVLYGYAGGGMVSLPLPKQKMALPEEVIKFTLTEEQWVRMQKATSVFNKPEVKITSDGTVVRMATANHKAEGGNTFSMILDAQPNGLICNMIFNKDHMNLLKGSYDGTITPTYAVFSNKSGLDLTYYIVSEPTTSTFNA